MNKSSVAAANEKIDSAFRCLIRWHAVWYLFLIAGDIGVMTAQTLFFDDDNGVWLLVFAITTTTLLANMLSWVLLSLPVENVIEMMAVNSPNAASVARIANSMPLLNRFKLLTHSNSLRRWFVFTLLTAYISLVVTLLSVYIFLLAFGRGDFEPLAVFAFWRFLSTVVLHRMVLGFWKRAVVGSVRRILPTESALVNYCKERAALVRARALQQAKSRPPPMEPFQTPASAAVCQPRPAQQKTSSGKKSK